MESTTSTKAHVFPLLPFLSREGTDGRNLCPNPSLAALALGRGDVGAEIHPGSTSFSQHLGKRATAGASQGREQERTKGGERSKEGTCQLSVTAVFQPMCHQGIRIISAQFCKQETLAPASDTRKLRLTEVKDLLQDHPAGDWLHSHNSNPGLSGSKNCELSTRPH